MRVFSENFDCLHCTEACFGAPEIVGQTLMIPVKHVPFRSAFGVEHPLALSNTVEEHPLLGKVATGLFVFRGVVLSRREISEYTGDPKNPVWKETYTIEDIDLLFEEAMSEHISFWVQEIKGTDLKLYPFEGGSSNPSAWIGYWDVVARSFELQVAAV